MMSNYSQNVQFNTDDLSFSFDIERKEDEIVAVVTHFYISEDNRGDKIGSAVIETIKRIAIQNLEADRVEVSIGGGEKTEEFLKSNGFKIINRRYYSDAAKKHLEGEYGVDAIYKSKWVGKDY